MSRKQAQASAGEAWISGHSKWSDPVWLYENETPGQRQCNSQIDWRKVPYGQDRNLFEHGPLSLLMEFKAFVEVSMDRSTGAPMMAAGSLASVQVGFGAIAQWLASERIESVQEIDEETSWSLIDWLDAYYEQEAPGGHSVGRRRELTHASAWRVINLLLQIYERRSAMREKGVGTIPERPFGRDSTALAVVVKDMGLKRGGRLLPIPDGIAIPLLTEAVRMIGVPANDVIDLQGALLPLPSYMSNKYEYRRSNKDLESAIQAFRFGACPGEAASWRGQIEKVVVREMTDGRRATLTVIQQFRRLIISVVEACAVVLQGLTGMRASEIIGLEFGKHGPECDPICLSSRLTRDASFEVFELLGRTSKGSKKPARWVIGARPAGSTYEPPPVRAVRVLGRLLDPWRKLGGRTTLLVTFRSLRGLPRSKGSIGPVFSTTLTQWQREFFFEYVDQSALRSEAVNCVPDHLHIRGHRWRTTFAIHMYRIHPGLVPAIADHFKHTSQVMTEHGYIGNDPSFLDAMDAARVQSTAMMMLRLSSGDAPAAGPAARLVKEYRAELHASVADERRPGVTALDRAENFVLVNGLHIYNSPHGACLIALMPMNSRCREISETRSWKHIQPDTSVRTPTVCAGCKCYMIWSEHLPYWKQVVEEHQDLLREAGSEERQRELRVSQSRLVLAKAIVNKIERAMRAGGNSDGKS